MSPDASLTNDHRLMLHATGVVMNDQSGTWFKAAVVRTLIDLQNDLLTYDQ